jgi:hypothetical protein
MGLLARLKAWYAERLPPPLSEMMTITCDDAGVRCEVKPPMSPGYACAFAWTDVRRVCFQDEGAYASDIVFVEITGRDEPALLYTEAAGGEALLGHFLERGLFPADLFAKTIRSTDGGLYCWPPRGASLER